MTQIVLRLEELITDDIDSISGRNIGQVYARKKNIIKDIEQNTFKIIISPRVKAINDSFIKGFFSEVFKKYKTKVKVKEKFTLEADPYFIELFDKNFTILESISNS
jgi:hypothetical protein